MSRTTGFRLMQAMMVGAVLCVMLLAYLDLRREQARALEDFSDEQAQLAGAVAGTLAARLEGISRVLSAALEADRADARGAEPLLRQLVRDDALYREADLVDRDGTVVSALPARPERTIADSASLSAARDSAVHEARAGRLAVSGPLTRGAVDPRERLRLIAAGGPSGRTIVLLVDGNALLGAGVAGAQGKDASAARWLLLDPDGRWIEWSEGPTLSERWLLGDSGFGLEVGRVLDEMSAGRRGAILLPREAAASLGLERRAAVAGFAPVDALGRRWSIAVVTSARRVRDRARVGAWRLVTATALASLLAGLFGLVVVRQQRHTLALAEQLRLAAATASLRERSEKILAAIPIGVLSVDARLRVRSINPFLVERGALFDETSADGALLGEALGHARPEELAALEALLVEARTLRRPVGRNDLVLHLDRAARQIDAHAIPLERPLFDTDCFLVIDDRTELRALERNLARAEKLATIGTLTAGVAHEVGTPLGIISGRAEQLLARVTGVDGDGLAGVGSDGGSLGAGLDREAMKKGLTSILAQVEKVSTTIRQLLDFARVRPIEGSAITPARLVHGAAALLDHRFAQARVTLTVDAPPTVPAVSGDPGQLEQVLVNLLMNAVDACAAGGAVTACARAGVADDVVIIVADNGCGIPPEQLGAVLDPFFTTKKRGQGTGLGLSIAADIVRNHGGTLSLESSVGVGTSVTITLPIAGRSRETA